MLIIQAPAKINLTLEVLGRRADGYHNLSSIFHTLNLADEARLTPADEMRLSVEDQVEGCETPVDERNTVWKAVALFQQATGWEQPFHIHLTKRIPSEAGLGGGSSDAASVLKGLCQLAQQAGVPSPSLMELAAQIGSDVPFFLLGGCARVAGRGETVLPLPPLPPFYWVLAKPKGVGVSTAEAYRHLQRPLADTMEEDPLFAAAGPHTGRLSQSLDRRRIETPENLMGYLCNDFEGDALPEWELLIPIQKRLKSLGALKTLLCGSGSTQAALCRDRFHALDIERDMRSRELDIWVVQLRSR